MIYPIEKFPEISIIISGSFAVVFGCASIYFAWQNQYLVKKLEKKDEEIEQLRSDNREALGDQLQFLLDEVRGLRDV